MTGAGSCVVAIHQPETLPWLGFIDKLRRSDIFVLLDHVQFEKGYFQNRNRIRSCNSDGWSWLTVPVLTKGKFGQAICDVEINGSVEWRGKHLKSIWQSYSMAPYFERYSPILKEHYEKSWRYLVDFNIQTILWITEAFGLKKTIKRSSELGVTGVRSELLLAICQRLGASTYLSGISGKEYLARDLFDAAGIAVCYQEFYHPIYRQCYEPFVPGLSSIDLLFNCADGGLEILESPRAHRLSALFT